MKTTFYSGDGEPMNDNKVLKLEKNGQKTDQESWQLPDYLQEIFNGVNKLQEISNELKNMDTLNDNFHEKLKAIDNWCGATLGAYNEYSRFVEEEQARQMAQELIDNR